MAHAPVMAYGLPVQHAGVAGAVGPRRLPQALRELAGAKSVAVARACDFDAIGNVRRHWGMLGRIASACCIPSLIQLRHPTRNRDLLGNATAFGDPEPAGLDTWRFQSSGGRPQAPTPGPWRRPRAPGRRRSSRSRPPRAAASSRPPTLGVGRRRAAA
eukprot:gene12020-biopygen11133